MGSVNSTGVYEYDNTDTGIGAVLLNLQSAALTTTLGSQTLTKRVANTTARATYAAGFGTITAANPCIVWRADAPVGQNLEFSINGSTWQSIPATTAFKDVLNANAAFAMVSRGAAQSIPNNVFTNLSFDTEDADPQGMFSLASPTYLTMQHTGLAIATLNIAFATGGTGTRMARITLESSPMANARLVNVDASLPYLSCSAIFPVTAGNKVYGQAHQTSGAAKATYDAVPNYMSVLNIKF